MNCPHCGAEVTPGHRFCQQCRKRVVADPAPRAAVPSSALSPASVAASATQPVAPPPPTAFERPLAVTVLAVLNLVGGVFASLAGLLLPLATLGGGREGLGSSERVVFLVFAGLYLLVGAAQITTGIGLLKLRPWARTLQIVGAGLGLLGIPCGTIISALILVYMLKPEVRTLFSGVPPRRLPQAEVARVQALSDGSAGTTVAVAVGAVAVGLVAVAVIGIIAAIAIPSLLRARVSANEASAIGDLRTVISAEAAYQSANSGFYDNTTCLAAPSGCIPGYPANGPVFLDRTFLSNPRHGYRFQFAAGTPATAEVVQRGQVSPSSLEGYVYLAVPLTQGQTGVRSFCADASGMICSMQGPMPESAGACPSECTPLQ
jgi:type IV pilus assembly protein PilA